MTRLANVSKNYFLINFQLRLKIYRIILVMLIGRLSGWFWAIGSKWSQGDQKCVKQKDFSLFYYRKSLINSPWAINFLTQGLLEVRAPGFLINKPCFWPLMNFKIVPWAFKSVLELLLIMLLIQHSSYHQKLWFRP